MSSNAVFPRSHVGFDSITSQIEKKLLKRGFQFNVMCVGMINPQKPATVAETGLLSLSFHRPDWSRQINPDQHHLRIASHRLKGSYAP